MRQRGASRAGAWDDLLDNTPMRIFCLLAVLPLALSGCGANDAPPQPKPFDIDGAWLYLGPSDIPHTLVIDDTSMVYADVDGQWSSSWTIKAYDNGAHHFQVAFASGVGSYLPVGEGMSGAYDVSASLLTVQLAKDLAAYPPLQGPGTCTGSADGTPVPDCRLYVKNTP